MGQGLLLYGAAGQDTYIVPIFQDGYSIPLMYGIWMLIMNILKRLSKLQLICRNSIISQLECQQI